MVYKWNTLKKKATQHVVGLIGGGDTSWYPNWELIAHALAGGVGDGTFNWRKNAEELQNEVIRVINRWDVRCAKRLVDLFPAIVPVRCRGVIPACYIEDKEDGEWVVDFGSKPA